MKRDPAREPAGSAPRATRPREALRRAYADLGLDIEPPRTAAQIVRTGYKIVARDDNGNLVSVWDGSTWHVGEWRTERATADHTGGFYFYATEDEAIAAANRNEVFGNTRREQCCAISHSTNHRSERHDQQTHINL